MSYKFKKIRYLISLIEFVEGVKVPFEHFEDWSLEKIEKKIEFYDYVSYK